MADDLVVEEVDVARIAAGGDLREAFLHVMEPWVKRGVTRWLDLVTPASRRPLLCLVAHEGGSPDALVGAIVGVWDERPIDRFDDLFEPERDPDRTPADRPAGGVWHLLAVTTRGEVRGAGVGRRLAGAALGLVARSWPEARVVTLSPATGLADVLERLRGASPDLEDVDLRDEAARVEAGLLSVVDAEGRPWLPILRFHLGNGARLEAVLLHSRKDDLASAQVTLRFEYSLDPAGRRDQKMAYLRWIDARQARLAAGEGVPLGEGACYLRDGRRDNLAPP